MKENYGEIRIGFCRLNQNGTRDNFDVGLICIF